MTFPARLLGALVLIAPLTVSAAAAQAPLDPRIRVIAYDPDKVFSLQAVFGFQTMIQFAPDEQIQNVSIGDGAAWQVTPNKAATLLFVKPIDIANITNMTVVTDRRSYLFELSRSATPSASPPYLIRFTYPPPPAGKAATPFRPPAPELRNNAYSYTGSRVILPSQVFDDGHFTYFKWPETSSTPALFVSDAAGVESIANYSVRDGYQVVEQTAPRFVLRSGKEVTWVINGGWRAPRDRAGHPAPR
jgi:type IV secretion system protein VirB9